jgi:hypothetical protein
MGEGPRVAVIDAVGGVQVPADHPRREMDRLVGQQARQDEVGERSGRLGRAAGVVECDQVVGLAAAEARFHADDRGVGRLPPAQTAERLLQQAAQAAGGVGVAEERGRVAVGGVGVAAQDAGERRGELLLAQLPPQDFVARPAGLEDGAHRSWSLLSPGLIRPGPSTLQARSMQSVRRRLLCLLVLIVCTHFWRL